MRENWREQCHFPVNCGTIISGKTGGFARKVPVFGRLNVLQRRIWPASVGGFLSAVRQLTIPEESLGEAFSDHAVGREWGNLPADHERGNRSPGIFVPDSLRLGIHHWSLMHQIPLTLCASGIWILFTFLGKFHFYKEHTQSNLQPWSRAFHISSCRHLLFSHFMLNHSYCLCWFRAPK